MRPFRRTTSAVISKSRILSFSLTRESPLCVLGLANGTESFPIRPGQIFQLKRAVVLRQSSKKQKKRSIFDPSSSIRSMGGNASKENESESKPWGLFLLCGGSEVRDHGVSFVGEPTSKSTTAMRAQQVVEESEVKTEPPPFMQVIDSPIHFPPLPPAPLPAPPRPLPAMVRICRLH